MSSPVWVIDTPSLISLRILFSRDQQASVRDALAALVIAGRVVFPREVVSELERYQGTENPALTWAKMHQGSATQRQPTFDTVKDVLASVPEVVDPEKEGVEDADPYVLAMAHELLAAGVDVRVVTEEFKTTTAKMNLGSAAGFLRIPSVSLKAMLKFEGIADF